MADNVTLDAGAGGDTIAADDVAGVKYQVVKLDVGGDGAAAPVSNSNPVPVSDAGSSLTVDNAGLTELAAAINASSQVDVNLAASAATVAVSNAGLTELAAAINASSQIDVNIAAQGLATLTVASHAVTNAGTFAVQVDGNALTALQLIDDYVFADDAAFTLTSSKVAAIGGIRDDSLAALAAVEGDVVPLRVSSTGALHVTGGGGGTEYTVDAAAPAAPTGATFVMERDDALSALTEIEGDWTNPRSSANGALWVSVDGAVTVGSHAVTNAGTFAVQVDGNALTALQLIDDPVFADDAAYTLGTSKASVIGGIAVETDGTDPTTVSAEGDAAALRTDRQRLLLVNQTHPRFWHVSADYGAAQTNASVKAAPGASLSLYITDLVLSNGATAGNITLLDGSGGTVLFEIYPAINGGVSKEFRNPIKLTANTALCITSTTVTTHSIFVSGYIAP